MYIITESQWDKIGDDFKTEHSITHGARACFEGCLNPMAECRTALLFEYRHFVVIPDQWQESTWADIMADEKRDRETLEILAMLSRLTDAEREDWLSGCLDKFKDRPNVLQFIALEYAAAEHYAHREGARP